MDKVYDGNVKVWQQIGEDAILAKGFGVTLVSRYFIRPTDKTEQEYHFVIGKEGVTIFALTTHGKVVLKEEFKQGTARICLECASAIIKKNENYLVTAARELQEETGFKATTLIPVPGRFVFGERKLPFGYRLVIATGCYQEGLPTPDEGEASFNVYLANPEEFWRAVDEEKIIACQTIHAASYAAAIGLIPGPR